MPNLVPSATMVGEQWSCDNEKIWSFWGGLSHWWYWWFWLAWLDVLSCYMWWLCSMLPTGKSL